MRKESVSKNKVQRGILGALPYFRGSWVLYTQFFRFLPAKLRFYNLADIGIDMDLSDPPQFSMIKTRNGIIEPGETEFIKKNLSKGDVFIDIGANWGYFTSLASGIVGKDGLVVSLEPFTGAYRNLLATIKRNRLFNVIALNIAAGESNGVGNFFKPWYKQSTSAYLSSLSSPKSDVLILPCDQIINNLDLSSRALKIIKIDAEGLELPVLKGMAKSLVKHKPAVIVEISLQCNKFKYSYEDTYSFLRQLNYRPVYFLDNGHNGKIINFNDRPGELGQIVFEYGL